MRQIASSPSSHRVDPRATGGRTTTISAAMPRESGTVVQRYAPAKATSAQPIRRRRA